MNKFCFFIFSLKTPKAMILSSIESFDMGIRTSRTVRPIPLKILENFENVFVNASTAKTHIILSNVSQLNEMESPEGIVQRKIESPELTVRGINWKVIVEKCHNYLAIFLDAPSAFPIDLLGGIGKRWTYDVEAKIKMLTFESSAQQFQQTFSDGYFEWGASKKGLVHFMNWNDFTNESRKFVVDDKANLVIEFKVGPAIALNDRHNPIGT